MGNCIGTEFLKSHKKIRPHGGEDEEEEEVQASCNGNKIVQDSQLCKEALAFPSKTELEDDRILDMIQRCSSKTPTDMAEDCNSQRVKIVVTRKQLKLLIKSGVELHLRRISNRSSVQRTCKKWRPRLATIPEL